MIKYIDNNSNLYWLNKVNYLKSLQYADSLIKKVDKPLEFHCFWKVPKEFGIKQLAGLISSYILQRLSMIR